MTLRAQSHNYAPLRFVTQRILTTPVTRLPSVAPVLAFIISGSRECFQAIRKESQNRRASEGQSLVLKLKTQISSLLNDKAPESRFSAVLLIKSIIEVGGPEILQDVSPWVRGLCHMLGVSNVSAS